MRKLTLTALFASLFLLSAGQNKQDVMVIEKTDGTTLRVNVEDIKRAVFETSYMIPGTVANPVDLGLSVKWASWNIGASSTTESGLYIGYGDTDGANTSKDEDDFLGANPPLYISGGENDAARTLWGNEWRMPTNYEFQELVDSCTWNYQTVNGIECVKATGPNGASLVMPLTGYMYGESISQYGIAGRYMTGTAFELDGSTWVNSLWAPKDSAQVFNNYGWRRPVRHTVRPVQGPDVNVLTTYVRAWNDGDVSLQGCVAAAPDGVVSKYGFLISESGVPTASNYVRKLESNDNPGIGYYSVYDLTGDYYLSGLDGGKRYSVCAYALINGQYYYGKAAQFTQANVNAISVATGAASDITETEATVTGTVSGVSSAITVGIIYGRTSSLSSTSGINRSTTSNGGFSITLVDLSENTTYYYRAYAYSGGNYYYGDTKSFMTKEHVTTGTLNGHDWVDLGLPSGTKWATCNVGALTPTGYGGYYSWGETSEKNSYTNETYVYAHDDGSHNFTMDYVGKDISGTSKDVAHVKWGSSWKMPTFSQTLELYSKCTFSSANLNGVAGSLVTGPNGNQIFLPFGGRKQRTSSDIGTKGYYWTSSCSYGYPGHSVDGYKVYGSTRSLITGGSSGYEDFGCWGYMVRPVTE